MTSTSGKSHITPRTLGPALAAAVMLLLSSAIAPAGAERPRITAPVDDTVRAALRGSVSPLARPEFDLGEAPADTQLTHVRLLLERSPAQQAALETRLAEVMQTTSPNYHKWLTPEQFGELYGPSSEDMAAITGWLEQEGLIGVKATKGRTTIEFSAPLGLVEQVFQTSIHSFKNGDREFLAHTADPTIPVALSKVVTGIIDMDTIQPESYLIPVANGRYDAATKRMVPVGIDIGEQPYLTGMKNGNPFLFMTPGDGATMYNTPNKTLNANFNSANSYSGSGVTIGIGGNAPIIAQTAANFRVLFLGETNAQALAAVTISNDGATSKNATNEAYLDIETSGGLAPGAAIHFYTASTIMTAVTNMLDDNSVDIFNLSFGLCEQNLGTSNNKAYLNSWMQAQMQGIAVTVSSGDTGSAGCDPKTAFPATQGLAVNGISSTPYNVSVGGTDTFGLVGDFSTYVSSTSPQADLFRSLLKPIPESPWNESQATPGPISEASAVPGRDVVNGGGGGTSGCTTTGFNGDLLTCLGGYAKPSWQAGTGVPNDMARDTPDVSLMASPGVDQAAWLFCTDTNGDCSVNSTGQFFFGAVGGTSASAPAFAGILALVEQKTGARLGQAATELYTLFNGSHGSEIFNDITTGNNSPPCEMPTSEVPSPDCKENAAGNYFESGYDAGKGYDQATGLGSVNATNLVNLWGEKNLASATVTVQPASTSILRGSALLVNVTVAGASGTPTGTVTLSSGAFTAAATTLASGKATISIPAGSLAAGTDTLTVTYSGDSTFGSATGSAAVKVTLPVPAVTVTPAALTVSRASSLSVLVAVASTSGSPTGTMTLTGGGFSSAAKALVSGKATIVIPADALNAGADSLVATYNGDANFATATGSKTVTVTAAKVTPKVTVTPASTSVPRAKSLSVKITVAPPSGTATGTVTLASGNYLSAATKLASGTATIVIPATKLSVGKETLTASYSGDGNDNTAKGTAIVTVTKLTPTVTVKPALATSPREASLSVVITVAAVAGTPTGKVTLSGGGFTSAATTLTGGKATIVVPASKLTTGADKLTAAYSGDTDDNTASGSATVTVTKLTPAVTLTGLPATATQTAAITVTVKVAVAPGTPTGTVTLAGGGFTSTATALAGGSAKITIAAGKLAVGADTLTATYSGDANNNTATAKGTVTVTK